MATEKGIVTKINADTAWVRTLPSEACAGCSSCGTCNAQREDAEVEVLNEVGARIGRIGAIAVDERLATKQDLKELEYRLIIRLGTMIVVAVGIVATLVKLL